MVVTNMLSIAIFTYNKIQYRLYRTGPTSTNGQIVLPDGNAATVLFMHDIDGTMNVGYKVMSTGSTGTVTLPTSVANAHWNHILTGQNGGTSYPSVSVPIDALLRIWRSKSPSTIRGPGPQIPAGQRGPDSWPGGSADSVAVRFNGNDEGESLASLFQGSVGDNGDDSICTYQAPGTYIGGEYVEGPVYVDSCDRQNSGGKRYYF